MDWRSVKFDWNRARAFLVTAEEGSLSAAARALGMAQPTLGRQVDALEQELGVVLFERTGRGLSPTPSGLELLDHVRAMGEAATRVSLTAAGQSQSIVGTVSIAASEVHAALVLPPILGKLRQAHPGIFVEIVASTRPSDLRRREADIAIRNFQPTDPDLIAKKIRDVPARLYGSPSYLRKIGNPTSPRDLGRAAIIDIDGTGKFRQGLAAMGFELGDENFPILTESYLVMWELVKQGLGIGILDGDIGDAEPKVRRVLPDHPPFLFPIWLVAHRELATSRRVRAVFDVLAEELARAPTLATRPASDRKKGRSLANVRSAGERAPRHWLPPHALAARCLRRRSRPSSRFDQTTIRQPGLAKATQRKASESDRPAHGRVALAAGDAVDAAARRGSRAPRPAEIRLMKRSLSVLVSSIVPLLLTACAAEPASQAPAEDAEQKEAFTLPLTTVKITDTTTHTVVATKTILAAGNAAWRESELGSVLANEQLPLSSTQITLDADSARQELLVFARDPAEHASTMTNLMEKMAAQPSGLTLFPTFWKGNQAKYDGIAGHPIALPAVLSLVNPAAHTLCFYPPCPSMISSSEASDFWDDGKAPGSAGTPSAFVPGLASPGGKGSVKGLFIMDHGACGQEVPWSELVDSKLDDAWTELKQEIHDNWDIDWGSRNFQAMTSYLDHAAGSLTDTRGGLIVTSQFFLKTYLGSDIGIDFSTRYGFKLTNGIVDVTPDVWLHVSGNNDVYDKFADKLGNGVPADIRKAARARQLAPIPASSLAAAKVLLTLGVGLSKSKLGLSEADVSALTAHVTNDANWSNVDGNGNCKPVDGKPACTFVVKAKRVNMFPDSLELVFFDGKDSSNSTYALYAGLVGADAQSGTHLVDQLCTRSIHAQGGSVDSVIDYTKRDYFTQSRGFQKYDP